MLVYQHYLTNCILLWLPLKKIRNTFCIVVTSSICVSNRVHVLSCCSWLIKKAGLIYWTASTLARPLHSEQFSIFAMLTSSQFLYFLPRNAGMSSVSFLPWLNGAILYKSGIPGLVTPLAAIRLLHNTRESCTRDRKLMT